MIRALPLILCATAATADDTRTLSHSTVTLMPSIRQGVVAEIHFHNSTHDGHLVDQFNLSLGGLTVAVDMTVGTPRPDWITVEPPEGLIAVPRTLSLKDGSSGVILILPLNSVGM